MKSKKMKAFNGNEIYDNLSDMNNTRGQLMKNTMDSNITLNDNGGSDVYGFHDYINESEINQMEKESRDLVFINE